MKPEPEQKPMTWRRLLVNMNIKGGGAETNLYHFLPEGVSLRDKVTRSHPEAFELVLAYREIKALQAEIRTKYPDRCLTCNGLGGSHTSIEVSGGEIQSYFEGCSDCVKQGLDPCDTSLSLLLSHCLREEDDIWSGPHTSIEEVDVDNLHYALSPTMGMEVSHHEWPWRDELHDLRNKIQGLVINMTSPEGPPF